MRSAAILRQAPLSEEDWTPRHKTMCLLVLAHVPAIIAYASLTGNSVAHGIFETLPIALLVGIATAGGSRLRRSCAATLGLVMCSAVLVHLSGGLIEMHFHFFASLSIITLYQDWRPYLAALSFVVAQHTVFGWIAPDEVYNHGGEWWWALVHGGFVLAASVGQVAAWKFTERAWRRGEEYREQLYEGEHALVERMRETERIRDDVVAGASHELRTPLTSILGSALTLVKYQDRLSTEDARVLHEGILRQSKLLAGLVENLLTAAKVSSVDPLTACDPFTVVPPGSDVEPGGSVFVDERALRQVVEALVRHCTSFGTDLRVTGALREGGYELEISAEAPAESLHRTTELMEPFVPGDGGLYVVRRLVEAYRGSMTVSHEDGRLRFVLGLRPVPAQRIESLEREPVA